MTKITRMNKRTRSTKSEKWQHTCNPVEIAWTNEQKVAVTSYGRNKNHDDEIKNIAGQVLKYNSKNWKKNSDVLYLTSRSIEQFQPEHKQNHLIKWRNKESNLNKNILIAKTLEAFKPKAKFFPFKNTYFKNMLKSNFCFLNHSSITSAIPNFKNSIDNNF